MSGNSGSKTTTKTTLSGWGQGGILSGGGRRGRWKRPNRRGREGFIFGDDYADYGANRCEPWPECLKGNFLGKLGPVGNNARMGKKKR